MKKPRCAKVTVKRESTTGPCLLAEGHRGDCKVKPVPRRPLYPHPAPIHVPAPDGDARDLGLRAARIAVEMADLGAEALRVRDQHVAQIDALKRDNEALRVVNADLLARVGRRRKE